MNKVLTCIDLFAGCGGFSLGLHRAGIRVLAAVDFDPKAVEVYRANFADTPHVLCADLTKLTPEELEGLIDTDSVDLIAGGPPCQGFSQVRQRDGANNGKRMVHDPRRTLYEQYFAYVEHFKPKVFVMENVLGIRSAAGGKYFTAVKTTARKCGYRVYGETVDAWEFGVPQKRRRQLIIGTRDDLPVYFHRGLITPAIDLQDVTVGHAISDLPSLKAGTGNDPVEYDQKRRKKTEESPIAKRYLTEVLEIEKAQSLTAHTARPHSDRDLRDFKKLREGETAKQALDRGETLEFPYDRDSFSDRYTRQHRGRLCSTIVAHLSKDGLMFIHPRQNRSLTPREAARIQSFPDWFQFPVARTHQFRVIGNAVPPLIGQAVGQAVVNFLSKGDGMAINNSVIPNSIDEAAERVMQLVEAARSRSLRKMADDEFKLLWPSVAFVYPGLHPDDAADHGAERCEDPSEDHDVLRQYPELGAPYYINSGWPVALEPVVAEACRRYEQQRLDEDEMYCAAAQMASLGIVPIYETSDT